MSKDWSRDIVSGAIWRSILGKMLMAEATSTSPRLSVCPIAVVNAPVETVWDVLMHLEGYSDWWDAQTVSIDPPGTARAGQVRACI